MKVLPGSPRPLGATWDIDGTNFALFSANATSVELCLFDESGNETRVPLEQKTAHVFHGYVPGIPLGQRYGYRVHGPYEPGRGHRFNPNVVLLDPYARAVDGVENWAGGCFAYELGHPDADLRPSEKPSLGAPRGVVIDDDFDWEGDEPPGTPLRRSVIYEAHVRGLTKLHPAVPEELRGTYLGVAHPAIIAHLHELGVTAIELMPVHAFVDDKVLLDRGLRNYWGYNSIGFFAPDVRYRSGSVLASEVVQFKQMVKALHQAGIEVLLDVVYNHTAEGNHLGPTLSLKGIDNATYYKLSGEDPRYYYDTTGTGNTLNVRSPQVLTLIMDSLRYWAAQMHVDGFRFDLAAALARQLYDVDQLSSFFTLIHQSPTLSHRKLIAEPWDVGAGGYQVGNFPVLWAEWNGRYRDAVRSLWRGDRGLGEIGYRLTGSADLYQATGRPPAASVNLVTAHDGFTLRDLTMYEHKHNEANGEGNRDGNDDERSRNFGVEGPSSDPEVNELRARQQRGLMATLLLSQGTPMIVAGDEFGRTQRGNNNAYCQDNETSWLDWNWSAEQRAFFAFTKRLVRLRADHPVLRRSKFFHGRDVNGTDLRDLSWWRPDGRPMSTEDWTDPNTRALAMFLAGRGIDDIDEAGRPLVDDNFMLVLNASDEDVDFRLPALESVREPWQLVIDSALTVDEARPGGETSLVRARSLKIFRSHSRVVRAGSAVHRLGATYRLQLQPAFGFAAARDAAEYLHALGISDVYSSPLLAAARGSTHGYDVVDHSRLNDELGGADGFRAFSDRLKTLGLGLLLDFVPNHMGIANGQNPYWDDVLENGPSAPSALLFDVDFRPPKADLRDRVLLPILDGQYGEVLERGELQVVWEAPLFRLVYGERRLPLAPDSLVSLLEIGLAKAGLDEAEPARQELESILSALRHLPERHERASERRRERAREKVVVERRLAELMKAVPRVLAGMNEALLELNGSAGLPASFDALDRLISSQSYRLASWRVAVEEINYRRFFDVNDLAAIRMELPSVFERAHALVFRLIDERRVNALRLDHTDGLYDPYAYFELLQRRFQTPANGESVGPDDRARPLPLLIEKILSRDEQLATTWPVDGTTGYEFRAVVAGLFVDGAAERRMSALYRELTGDQRSFAEHVYDSKQHIVSHTLVSEMNMLARDLERIAGKSRRWRDFTLQSLTRALTEVVAAFPVYRTYLRLPQELNEADQQIVRASVRLARRRNASLDPSVFEFIQTILLADCVPVSEDDAERAPFALRFQQLTGPVAAKSVEDTAFYRYTRLVCLNDVGGNPQKFGTSIAEFHRANTDRARNWPLGMTTGSTHDTKRGEDAAASIAVLSEMPGNWRRAVRRWRDFAPVAFPSSARPLEYLFYQTLIGAWPYGWDGRDGRAEFVLRLEEYMTKAAREAKQETSWLAPAADFEKRVSEFARGLFESEEFVEDARGFAEVVAPCGAMNGLAACLLRHASPGIPDTYQGAELWHQCLVDPDNRGPVDYALRRRYLAELDARSGDERRLVRELLETFQDGRIKLYVIHRALLARRKHRELFLRGDYEPLDAGEHAVAFARRFESSRLLCVVPRLSYGLTGGRRAFPVGDVWMDARVEVPYAGRYENVLTGETLDLPNGIALAELFREFPLALLVQAPP